MKELISEDLEKLKNKGCYLGVRDSAIGGSGRLNEAW